MLPTTAKETLPYTTLHNAMWPYVMLNDPTDWLRLPTTANQTLPYATPCETMQP